MARKALFTSRVKIEDERPNSMPLAILDRLVDVGRADERGRRAEDLLLRDPHARLDVAEDRRPVEGAAVEPVLGRDLAAGQERRALVLADLGVRVDLLQRRAVHDRADVRRVLEPVAEPELLGSLDELRRERVVDALAGDDAARGGAALAGRAEGRPEDPLDGEVEVGVVHDDDGVLAAELEVDVLEVGGAVLGGLDPDLARAGERDQRHVRVLDEALADRLAAAVHDVEHAGGQAGLLEDLDEALAEHAACRGPA